MKRHILYAALTAALGSVLSGLFGCSGMGGAMGASQGGQSAGCGYPATHCPSGYLPAPGEGGQCMPAQQVQSPAP